MIEFFNHSAVLNLDCYLPNPLGSYWLKLQLFMTPFNLPKFLNTFLVDLFLIVVENKEYCSLEQ